MKQLLRTRVSWIPRTAAVLVSLSACLAGCTPAQYAKQADKTGYSAVAGANRAALGDKGNLDITYRPYQPTTAPASRPAGAASQPTTLPCEIRVATKVIPVGGEGALTAVTLDEAMDIAFRNSREFQTRKELLFSEGLAVANSRRAWNWTNYGGDATGDISRTVGGNADSVSTLNASLGPTLLQNLMSGGQIALGSSLDFASSMSGVDDTAIGSLLSANLTQPLLQGAWRGIAYEPQYRLERDLVLSAYDYQRYTENFAVLVANSYYAVLQKRDQVSNAAANIVRLKKMLGLTTALVEGGERAPLERDQAEQNYLNAQVNYQTLLREYNDLLDNFKILLGVPVISRLELDSTELKKLSDQGLQAVAMEEREAIRIAQCTRPDVLTARAAVRDADRDVVIAADRFNPQLDLLLGTSVASQSQRKPFKMDFGDATRFAGATFDYPLDQTNHRDAYRNAIIAAEKARRDLDGFMDVVSLQVRNSFRSLEQARTSYRLQQKNVQIARRLRKLAVLQHQAGEVAARDVLDAEEALRNAEDGLTQALISYTTARLSFLVTLGLLDVDDRGKLHERDRSYNFGRIQRIYPYLGAAPAAREKR